MADEADLADVYIQQLIENPVNPYGYLPKITPTGSCHYCEATLEEPTQLFCDGDCAQDWTRIMQQASRQGRPLPR